MEEKNSYKVSASVGRRYAPLITRSRMLHEQTSKSEFPQLRDNGATNFDLWIDGSLYPRHPDSLKHPSFTNVSSLLQFVGDGKRGLLGYVESLAGADSLIGHRLDDANKEIRRLQEQVRSMIESARERDRLLHFSREESLAQERLTKENKEMLLANELLKKKVQLLIEECNCAKSSYIDNLSRLDALIVQSEEERLQLEIDSWIEIESQREIHEEQLKSIERKLKSTTAMLRRREKRLKNLVKTPYGYRSIVRERKDLSALSQNEGHAKRVRRIARTIIVPTSAKKIQLENHETGSRQRLCGSKETQMETGKALASMLTQTEVTAMCETSKLNAVGIRMANHYFDKVRQKLGPFEIQEVCDRNAITQDGWRGIFKKYKGAVKAAGQGLRVCLPNPFQVTTARTMLNLKLREYVGEYSHIVDSIDVAPTKKSKDKNPMKVELNEFNSFFVDVEQVQRTMVDLYNITPQELGNKPLIFVLKMDEAEVIHAQKLERVSIMLMNRALDATILPNTGEYFSVQSEREIWPVASFQIPRETHEILSWVFSKTKIPALIRAQGEGQLLDVPGIGSFPVEWHLACDLKTIKCLYGLKMGANSLHCCIYCSQPRVKGKVLTREEAEKSMKSGCKHSWDDGLFSKKISAKPVSSDAMDGRWRPIFAIPLDRVHVCTLHAFNRIIEKIVHLHFMHVWTIRNEQIQAQATTEMEKVVSLTGPHGSNVVIFKSQDLSGKSNNVPNKPSFSGAHALKLFKSNPTAEDPKTAKPLYIDLVNSEKNLLRKGLAKREKQEQWEALDQLRPYFTGLRLTEQQSLGDFKVKVDTWAQKYLKCWGEYHVTHYMHLIVRHGPYFLEKYGSLAVWSCQGMENSHHAAKNAYQRHTQHCGGRIKKSPLVQTYQHWYRIIAHRFRNKETILNEAEFQTLNGDATIAARREASVNSSANAHSALWRAKCTRVGSKWVPNQDVNLQSEVNEIPST